MTSSSETTAFLHPFTRPAATADTFTTIVRGEGAVVWDTAGRAYLDMMAGLWYCNAGYGRHEIADAVAEQLRALGAYHAFERFTPPAAEELAAKIVSLAPELGSRVFFTSSGSEAVDSALKFARLFQALSGAAQRTIIVSRHPSYHGVTYGGTTATGLPVNQASFGPLVPDMLQVGKDDLDALAALFAAMGDRIAAVMAEPVVGAGGVYPPAPGYLEGVRKLCDDHGALLILDEVITGFGRLGTWWGSQHYRIRPDMTTFAKAVTSGYQPLGGVVVAPSVAGVLAGDQNFVLRHGHTYSGHPAACAAGLAAIAITEREDLLARAVALGKQLGDGLRTLTGDGLVAEIRGEGAVFGVGLHPHAPATAFRDRLLDQGIIVRPIGSDTVALCPPLVLTDAQIDRCVSVMSTVLSALDEPSASA
jgi:adenosylmethionine-8-amino-7-oxononanoate aminotransferase